MSDIKTDEEYNAAMGPDVQLVRMAGLFSEQVCALASLTDEEIEAAVNRGLPTGLTGDANRWRITETDDPRRVVCANDPERVHVVLACGGFAETHQREDRELRVR